MNRTPSDVRLLMGMVAVAFLLTIPCTGMAQGTVQVGGGLALSHSDEAIYPNVSILVTKTVRHSSFGVEAGWTQGTYPSWEREDFLFASGRYYSTDNLERAPLYAFVGAGCVARMLSYKSASDGEGFFADGIPGTHRTTFGPSVELGIGSSLLLSPKSFVSVSTWANINTLRSFVGAQIFLGIGWR